MAKISASPNMGQVDLNALKQLADQAGDTDKIRGRDSSKRRLFQRTQHFKELYSSSKAPGHFKVGKRAQKQQDARVFIESALTNTLRNSTRVGNVTVAVANIMNAHTAAGQEVTGADLKAIVQDAEALMAGRSDQLDHLASQLDRTTTFDDVATKAKGLFTRGEPGIPVSRLPISKHVQSVFRLPGKLDMTVTRGGETHQITRKAVGEGERPERNEFLTNLFSGLNRAIGNPLSETDLEKRVDVYGDFNSKGDAVELLDPFRTGQREDHGSLQDILILKFATKECAAYAIAPIGMRLQEYCDGAGLDTFQYTVPIRDQVDAVHIDILDNGNFIATGSLTLPLKSGEDVVGEVHVALKATVDSTTGQAQVDVNVSQMSFVDGVDNLVKEDLLRALNTPLPT